MCDKRGQRSTAFSLSLSFLSNSLCLARIKALLPFHSNLETFLTLWVYHEVCVSVNTLRIHDLYDGLFIYLFFFWGFFLMLCISLNSYYLKWRAGGDCELGETAISTITTCVCLCECVYVCLSGVLSIPYASSTISSFSSLFLFFFMNINAITLGSESCSAPQQMHKHEMRKEKKIPHTDKSQSSRHRLVSGPLFPLRYFPLFSFSLSCSKVKSRPTSHSWSILQNPFNTHRAGTEDLCL